jgi:hypothetical protein
VSFGKQYDGTTGIGMMPHLMPRLNRLKAILTATVVSRKEDVHVALAFLLLAALAFFFFSSRGAVSLLYNNDEHVARKRSYGSHARV